MKFSSYSQSAFNDAVTKLKKETDVEKFRSRLNSLREWLEWLKNKKHIQLEEYNKNAYLITTVERYKEQYFKPTEKKTTKHVLPQIKLLYIITLFLLIFSFINLYFYLQSSKNSGTTSTELKGRVLPFKGTIQESSGEPLNSKRDVIFRIYSSPQGGEALYTGTCIGENGILPQYNGAFSILIGSDCNMDPISEDLFREHATLYIGVTIGSGSELKPRHQIFTTTYAQGTSLHGKSIGGGTSSIPFIDEKGQLQIEAESPTLTSTNGTFTIKGKTLTLQATETVEGNIIFKTGEQSNVLIENGRLGIGDFTPSHLLSVESSQPFSSIGSIRNLSVQDDPSTSALHIGLGTSGEGEQSSFIEFFAGATTEDKGIKVGGIRLNNNGVVYETGGADFAEYFNITYIDDIQTGSIVSISSDGVRASLPNEKIVGVVTDRAGFIGNYKENTNDVLVGLVGQLDVLVSNLYGDIKKGTRIGATQIPGYGGAVRREDFSAGYALEDMDKYSFSSEKCPSKYRKLRDVQGKRIKCGHILIVVDPD